mmetsp:Transcript_43197/g.102914  ORF Transcript_43197/g.102914 Transcript_43197/m.102914 type:complete len:286 (-) Transcript_43197:20-877(-)
MKLTVHQLALPENVSDRANFLANQAILCASLLVRSPEGQIVSQQLHDQGRVLVRVLCHIVQLGNGILESSARHLAGIVGIAQHLVHEHRVVQGQAKADGMCHGQIFLGNVLCLLVGLAGLLSCTALGITVTELCNVAVVVSLHLLVEYLGLTAAGLCDQLVVQKCEDGVADGLQLVLNLLAVLLCIGGVLRVALGRLLLHDARDDAPRSTARAHSVLVGHRQQVALLYGKLAALVAHVLHVVGHLIIALRLLSKLCKVHLLGTRHCLTILVPPQKTEARRAKSMA